AAVVVHEDPPRPLPESDLHAHGCCTLLHAFDEFGDDVIERLRVVANPELFGPFIKIPTANQNLASDTKRRQRRDLSTKVRAQRAHAETAVSCQSPER